MADYEYQSGYAPPLGSVGAEIVSLNASGVAAGNTSDRNDGYEAFIGREDGSSEKIRVSGSRSTALYGIDDAGDVAGTYRDGPGVGHGFARLNTGAYVELDDVVEGGADSSSVAAMSASGEVAGTYTKGGVAHAFVADVGTGGFENVTTVDLKDNDGASITTATVYGVNNEGDIVGSYEEAGQQYGFVEHDGTTTTLRRGIVGKTVARGINNKEEVVGYSVDAAAHHHGFTYIDGVYTTLDVDNSPSTEAYAVNDSGQVTGNFATVDDDGSGYVRTAGFVWTGDGATAIGVGQGNLHLVTINGAGAVGGYTTGPDTVAVYAPVGGATPPPATNPPGTTNPPPGTTNPPGTTAPPPGFALHG